jgi:hypothetical protein
MTDDLLIITTKHCRLAGFCIVPGVRDFCARNSFDYKSFIKHGITADKVIATGDAMAAKVVAIARQEVS